MCGIQWKSFRISGENPVINTITVAEILQLATAAHFTIWTKMISFRKDHIQNQLAGISHHFGICLYFHSLGYRKCT